MNARSPSSLARLPYALWGMAIAGLLLSVVGWLLPIMTSIMMPLLIATGAGLLLQLYRQQQRNRQIEATLQRYHQRLAQAEAQQPLLRSLTETLDDAQRQRQELDAACQEKQEQVDRLQQELTGLNAELAQAAQRYQQELDAAFREKQEQVDRLQDELTQRQQALAETQNTLTAAQDNLADVQAQCQHYTHQLRQIRTDYQAFEELTDEQEDRLRNYRQQIATLEETQVQHQIALEQFQEQVNEQTATIQRLTGRLQEAQTAIASLEQDLERCRNPKPPLTYTSRPPRVSDEQFARFAEIQLKPFPQDLQEQAQEHYRQRNGYNGQSLSQNALIAFLRHQYTNYELLCRDLDSYNSYASHILRARVNARIWDSLAGVSLDLKEDR
jgi:predicted  nucleic acid-binding Zn-ribbon protein